jgi:hypothetical protein
MILVIPLWNEYIYIYIYILYKVLSKIFYTLGAIFSKYPFFYELHIE